MNLWPWSKRADLEEPIPDTLREGTVPIEVRLQAIEAKLDRIELVLLDISAALVGQGYTLKTHLDSHAKDARRDHLRRVITKSEEA